MILRSLCNDVTASASESSPPRNSRGGVELDGAFIHDLRPPQPTVRARRHTGYHGRHLRGDFQWDDPAEGLQKRGGE
jgi:hypothetical protein